MRPYCYKVAVAVAFLVGVMMSRIRKGCKDYIAVNSVPLWNQHAIATRLGNMDIELMLEDAFDFQVKSCEGRKLDYSIFSVSQRGM